MTSDRTPKQEVVEKILKEIGELFSDQKIADLASKILGELIKGRYVRSIRNKCDIHKRKPFKGNTQNHIKKTIGLDYESPLE